MSYKRLLVIGERGVGKTSILSRAITGTFVEEYIPSPFQTESFFDVEHRLEFVDTPGLDGGLLCPEFESFMASLKANKPKKPKLQSFIKFQNDPTVQEILGVQEPDKAVLLRGLEFSTLYGFVIVYGSSLSSQKMAAALKEALASNNLTKKRPIFMVRNLGDVPRTKYEPFWKAVKGNGLFTHRSPLHKHLDFTEYHTVSASTGEGIERFLDAIGDPHSEVHHRAARAARDAERACETTSCSVM